MPESAANKVEPPAPRPGLPPIPGYTVERFVGRGGMGVVYRAIHAATGRVVVLKLTNPGTANDDITRERFAREVHGARRAEHPTSCPSTTRATGTASPTARWSSCPAGRWPNTSTGSAATSARASAHGARWPVRVAATLHAAGVLHRDLKPLNILLGDDDEPMVADFGLAKWIDEDRT